MRMFFSKISRSSVQEAKNRLKSVIKSDRINLSCDNTMEKIKKEVSAVLEKYAANPSKPPHVSVTCQQGTVCIVAASVALEKENYIR